MGDSDFNSDVKYWEPAQEVTEQDFSILLRNNSFNIVVTEVAEFCLVLKNLPEAKVQFLINCIRGNLRTAQDRLCPVDISGNPMMIYNIRSS